MSSKQFTSWRSMTSTHYDSHRLLANLSWYIHINSEWKFSALFNNSVRKCCLHSFYYIFSDLLSFQRQYPLPWSESELTIPGTKVAGNIRSREQKFPGAKVPGNFRSWERRFPLGTRSEQRKYRGAKSPDTSLTLITCRYVTSTRYVLLCH